MADLATLWAADLAFVGAGSAKMAKQATLETGALLNIGFVGAEPAEMAKMAASETNVLFFVAALRAELEGRTLFFLGAEPGVVGSAVADEAADRLGNL
jgi:hypothetical protein